MNKKETQIVEILQEVLNFIRGEFIDDYDMPKPVPDQEYVLDLLTRAAKIIEKFRKSKE